MQGIDVPTDRAEGASAGATLSAGPEYCESQQGRMTGQRSVDTMLQSAGTLELLELFAGAGPLSRLTSERMAVGPPVERRSGLDPLNKAGQERVMRMVIPK